MRQVCHASKVLHSFFWQQRWRYWQTQLPAEDIQRLLEILRQANTPAQRANRFKQLFKQVAIAPSFGSFPPALDQPDPAKWLGPGTLC